MNSVKLGVLLFLIAGVALAQQEAIYEPGSNGFGARIEQIARQRQVDFNTWEAEKHARELLSQQKLERRMYEFSEAWVAFTKDMHETGTFDVRLCQEVNRAFERLQNTRGWLKPDNKQEQEKAANR